MYVFTDSKKFIEGHPESIVADDLFFENYILEFKQTIRICD